MERFADIAHPESLQLGDDNARYSLASLEDNRLGAQLLARQAKRRVDLFTPDMEPQIYDSDEFIDALTQLALDSRQHGKTRILTIDTERPVKYGHRLIELKRRLSSFIEIRQVHEDYRSTTETFLLIDDRGLLHRPLSSRYEGSWSVSQPLEVRQRDAFFNEVWERSSSIPDFNRLHI